MYGLVRYLLDRRLSPLRRSVITIYAVLVGINIGVWAWAGVLFYHQPVLLGTALLAYGFGLRHAVDADHIAAIDNVTRKLMQEGKRPVTVGFFFAMGHATVVILAAAAIAAHRRGACTSTRRRASAASSAPRFPRCSCSRSRR